jgi:hypothetical protein
LYYKFLLCTKPESWQRNLGEEIAAGEDEAQADEKNEDKAEDKVDKMA